MSDDTIPRAIRSETMRVGDIEVEVHVLDDGRRIIERESFMRLLGLLDVAEAEDGQ